uniref:Plastid lipid-associated protein/fibrillin conserved domain-containing protein n=1 Tax=Compsopogon caeruleus TaxID=31354 RepID=A0A7S1XE93_9RHOD|mmetsp:Transcript_16831/g.34809  ORF Transcript_16831/g.34809 Transcript_16831/m.34809 type:complete len:255 (+) Transcript_16831:404-1168(+)
MDSLGFLNCSVWKTCSDPWTKTCVIRDSHRSSRLNRLRPRMEVGEGPAPVLWQAAMVGRGGAHPNATELGPALQELEQVRRRRPRGERTPLDATAELGRGAWRVLFILPVTAQKVLRAQSERREPSGIPFWSRREGFFFPLHVQHRFQMSNSDDSNRMTFINSVILGPLVFRLIGPARWVASANRMEFNFAEARLQWGNLDPIQWKIGEDSIDGSNTKDLPFFSFFFIDDRIAASRGRGGGLCLYGRVQPEDER